MFMLKCVTEEKPVMLKPVLCIYGQLRFLVAAELHTRIVCINFALMTWYGTVVKKAFRFKCDLVILIEDFSISRRADRLAS